MSTRTIQCLPEMRLLTAGKLIEVRKNILPQDVLRFAEKTDRMISEARFDPKRIEYFIDKRNYRYLSMGVHGDTVYYLSVNSLFLIRK